MRCVSHPLPDSEKHGWRIWCVWEKRLWCAAEEPNAAGLQDVEVEKASAPRVWTRLQTPHWSSETPDEHRCMIYISHNLKPLSVYMWTHLCQQINVLLQPFTFYHPAHGILGTQHQNHRPVCWTREFQRFQQHSHLTGNRTTESDVCRSTGSSQTQTSCTCVFEDLAAEITWVSLAPPSLAPQPIPASKRWSWACTGCSAPTGHTEHCSSLLNTDAHTIYELHSPTCF